MNTMNQCMANDSVGVSKSMKVLVVAMTMFLVGTSFVAAGAALSWLYSHATVKVSSEAGQ